MLATIITARFSSSRLKGKILKKINKNFCSIDILILRAQEINLPIILCTSKHKTDNTLVAYVKKNYPSVKIYRGSLINKIKRWYDCFKKFNIEIGCMIDGDDLAFCYKLYKKSLNKLKKDRSIDLIQYSKKAIPGLFTYSIKFSALEKLKKIFYKHKDSEMVDPYFKKARLKKGIISCPKFMKNQYNIRLTMDYKEDLFFFKKLYKKNLFNSDSKYLISYLNKNNKLKKINFFRALEWEKNQKQKLHII